ncbi:ABC transporter ATP-binding protein [Helicobacter marmotae]|uniref:ABC transporter ATP-binding protein n=1 Tax=Helicobacter marmotae TaxID=152490 RepID=A0A3D8I3Q6_9HELI|nr:ABC transporter ATP-binding protein [Helicobacter marmotae]RDU59645.1 ABC transporter ATP-binding protein [Helicobacter marmotae]
MSLSVSALSYTLGHKVLLDDISFRVTQGEFLGILGANGAGKSTLLKHILGILPLQKGEITLFDKPIGDYSIKELSKLIGFVPQKSGITMPLLVRDVLLMGKYGTLQNAFTHYSKDDVEQVEEMACALKIEAFLFRNVLSLSGGEFQRVLLARALLKKPKILCLDEPTSALDLHFAIELLSLCEHYIRTHNIMVIAILHDVNLASLFCHRLIFLKNGALRYDGKSNDLLVPAVLKEIYGLECEVMPHKGRAHIIISKESV